MFEYLVTLILVFFVFLAFQLIVYPRQRLQSYAKVLESKGFKVLKLPFKPFGAPMFEKLNKHEKEGDTIKAFK